MGGGGTAFEDELDPREREWARGNTRNKERSGTPPPPPSSMRKMEEEVSGIRGGGGGMQVMEERDRQRRRERAGGEMGHTRLTHAENGTLRNEETELKRYTPPPAAGSSALHGGRANVAAYGPAVVVTPPHAQMHLPHARLAVDAYAHAMYDMAGAGTRGPRMGDATPPSAPPTYSFSSPAAPQQQQHGLEFHAAGAGTAGRGISTPTLGGPNAAAMSGGAHDRMQRKSSPNTYYDAREAFQTTSALGGGGGGGGGADGGARDNDTGNLGRRSSGQHVRALSRYYEDVAVTEAGHLSSSTAPPQAHVSGGDGIGRSAGHNTTQTAPLSVEAHVALRGDPWSAFVAYDASLQLCLRASSSRVHAASSSAAGEFLSSGCRVLRKAFALQERTCTLPGEEMAVVNGAWEDGTEDEINAVTGAGGLGAGAGSAAAAAAGYKPQRRLLIEVVDVDSSRGTNDDAGRYSKKKKKTTRSSHATSSSGGSSRRERAADALRAAASCAHKFAVSCVGGVMERIGSDSSSPNDALSARAQCSVTWTGPGGRRVFIEGVRGEEMELALPPCAEIETAGGGEEISLRVGNLGGALTMPADVPHVEDAPVLVVLSRNWHASSSATGTSGSASSISGASGPARARVRVRVLPAPVASPPITTAAQQFAHDSVPLSRRPVTACRPSAQRLYDILLRVALRDLGFGPRRLLVSGKWKWLVAEFAAVHGVSAAHQRLALMYHLLGASTPTKDCLDAVASELKPLIRLRDNEQLSAQEKVQLASAIARVERLLSSALENFRALDDSRPSGYLDVPTAVEPRRCIAPLSSAVELHACLHDPLLPDSQKLLRDRLRGAARRRYRQVVFDVEQHHQRLECSDVELLALEHDAMAELARRLRVELEADGEIAARPVLGPSVRLEPLMGHQYAALLSQRLRQSLRQSPPSRPTRSALGMINSVADLETDIARCGGDAAASTAAGDAGSPRIGGVEKTKGMLLSSVSGGGDTATFADDGQPPELSGLFMEFVDAWIGDLQSELEAFCGRVRVPREGGGGSSMAMSGSPGSPGRNAQHTDEVETVLTTLTERLVPFETIINRWNDFAISLEDAIATVVRCLVERLEEQIYGPAADGDIGSRSLSAYRVGSSTLASESGCGSKRPRRLRSSRRDSGASDAADRSTKMPVSPVRERGKRMGASRLCVGRSQAYVLNALKKMMVTLPSLELQVREWIGEFPRVKGRGKYGVRFQVVMGELQHEYANLLRAVVGRVADDVFITGGRTASIRFALQAMGATRDASRNSLGSRSNAAAAGDLVVPEEEVERALQPAKSMLADAIRRADEVLLPRVFVSFVRGLWDAAGRDMQLHLDDLSSARENQSWLQRCAAAAAMDNLDAFFKSAMQERHEVHEKDLRDEPEAVRKCHQELGKFLASGSGNNTGLYTSYTLF